MNTVSQVLSNVFKVKDKLLVKRLLGSAGFYVDEYDEGLCFYDNDENSAYLCDMQLVKYDGYPIVVQTDYNEDEDFYFAIEEYAKVKEDDINEDLIETVDFFEWLQSQLLDGESIQVTEIAHEGLRWQNGSGVVITQNGYQWFDLNRMLQKFADEHV